MGSAAGRHAAADRADKARNNTMEGGCLANLVKYLLFLTNFLIFGLGLAVCGLGAWVLVDKPSFLNLFEQAKDVCKDACDGFDVTLYTSAAYILVAIAALVVVIAFFGCCGAIKENKCMLGTYFTLILALFIAMVVGAVLGYSGDLEKTIKTPLKTALEKYRDQPADNSVGFAYKEAWNEVQKELKCCGIDNVKDWKNANITDWSPETANKPDGCCQSARDGTAVNHDACRASTDGADSQTYYFEGCYTIIKNEIEENQNIVIGVAIGVVVVMFLNMMFSFAMCTMVR